MSINWLILLTTSFIPMAVGFLWYNPSFLGKKWQEASGLSDEKIKNANMPLIFGFTILFSFFASLALNFMVIHQFHVFSIVMDEPSFANKSSELNAMLNDFMTKYGNNFRTFKHGAFHGVIAGIMLALPVTTVNALFERKGFVYIAINAGYWIVCFALMGGVICAFS